MQNKQPNEALQAVLTPLDGIIAAYGDKSNSDFCTNYILFIDALKAFNSNAYEAFEAKFNTAFDSIPDFRNDTQREMLKLYQDFKQYLLTQYQHA